MSYKLTITTDKFFNKLQTFDWVLIICFIAGSSVSSKFFVLDDTNLKLIDNYLKDSLFSAIFIVCNLMFLFNIFAATSIFGFVLIPILFSFVGGLISFLSLYIVSMNYDYLFKLVFILLIPLMFFLFAYFFVGESCILLSKKLYLRNNFRKYNKSFYLVLISVFISASVLAYVRLLYPLLYNNHY